jgi:hypothetical protein
MKAEIKVEMVVVSSLAVGYCCTVSAVLNLSIDLNSLTL